MSGYAPSGPNAQPPAGPGGHQPPPTHGLWAVLAVAAVIAAGLGLAVPENESNEFQVHLAWAIFASVALVVQLAPTLAPMFRQPAARAWPLGAVGVGGLVVYWLLLVLPSIESNHGFALTLGTAAAALGLWLAPGRPAGPPPPPAAAPGAAPFPGAPPSGRVHAPQGPPMPPAGPPSGPPAPSQHAQSQPAQSQPAPGQPGPPAGWPR